MENTRCQFFDKTAWIEIIKKKSYKIKFLLQKDKAWDFEKIKFKKIH